MPNKPKNLLIRPLFSRMVIHAKVRSKKFIHIGSMTMTNNVCFWKPCLRERMYASG